MTGRLMARDNCGILATSSEAHMGTWTTSGRPTRWARGRRPVAMFAIALSAFLTAYGLSTSHTAVVVAQKGGELDGTGTVSGTVTATKSFKAAQVYLRSTDQRRHMLYMVYTNAGA